MKKYTQLLVVLFLEFLAIGCNATCTYDTTQGYCIFLDLAVANSPCNKCSPDTNYMINIVPNSIVINSYTGPCGCISIIQVTCLSLIIDVGSDEHALALISMSCTRTGQDYAVNIINGEACLGCPSN